MSIEENYKRVQDGIADACAASGRNTDEITLIAVTKFVPWSASRRRLRWACAAWGKTGRRN
jgi:uncharacterized pyridoxal phosphate-containing UPF0001 family protein